MRSAFFELILARVREFYREPITLFWVYGFPVLLALILGAAFASSVPKPPVVDVQESQEPRTAAVAEQLRKEGFDVEMLPPELCKRRLARNTSSLFLVVRPDAIDYVFDPARAESFLARWWTQAVLTVPAAPAMIPQPVEEKGSRYIDFLLPGLIGINLMGGGLFGIGFVLVDMRVRKLFKRLMATPMRHSDFLLALFTARLLFLLPEMMSLLLLGHFLFGVPIKGSLLLLAAVILLGAGAFSGLGLLLGCRTDKTETMSGFINLVMLPMYLLSGVFFTSKRFPDWAQPFVQALPLTQLNDALRAVMLDGAGIQELAWPLAILAGWAVITFALALRWFRWR